MKKIYLIALIVFMLPGVTSCVKEGHDVICPPLEPETVIPLIIDDHNIIETYSVATPAERHICDAFILVFDGATEKYKAGEMVADIENDIVGNDTQYPKITTSLLPAAGDKVMVLANTHQTSLPSGLTAGTTIMTDVNTLFPIKEDYPSNDIPMCGIKTWGTTTECEMVRSIAKIEVRASVDSSDDVTGFFNTSPVYGVWNYPLFHESSVDYPTYGDIYNATATVAFPSSYSTMVNLNDIDCIPSPTHYNYFSELPTATKYLKAGALHTISDSQWSSERFCITVQVTDGTKYYYYRLDLYDAVAGKYLDIKRNCHYVINITKVKSYGYLTVEEAVANPGSNLEYKITVTGDEDNYTSTNGQYALISDKNGITLLDGSKTPETLKFSLQTELPLNISSAFVEIVDASKNTAVAMPDCFTVENVGTSTVLGVSSDRITLGTLTADSDFSLKTNATADYKESLAALAGCYLHIHMGNIDKYIPISASSVLTSPSSFYYGQENCHEVPSGVSGSYSFDVSPYTSSTYQYENNQSGDLLVPRSAAILWSDVSATHITNPTVVKDGIHGTLHFDCDGSAGNALVAVYDKEDPMASDAKILWSYHIWVSDRKEAGDMSWSVINTTTKTVSDDITYYMMDRNLGATSGVMPTLSNGYDISCFGLFYQWGRKDPFIGAKSKTEKVSKTLYKPDGTTTARTSEKSTETTGTINYSITHPTTFITQMDGRGNDTGYDWLYAARDHALWGNPHTTVSVNVYPHPKGEKSIYDPCPKGYQVPPQDAFTMIVKTSYAICSSGGLQVGDRAGWHYVDYSISAGQQLGTLGGLQFYYQKEGDEGDWTYLPGCGAIDRSNGNLAYSWGGSSLYWTNTNLKLNNPYASRMSFSTTSWNPIWDSGRATGQSVRCCRVD